MEEAFADVDRHFGGRDLPVDSAGIGRVATIAAATEEDFDRLYEVNVKGVFLCTRAALPSLVARGGGVVLNTASIATLTGVRSASPTRSPRVPCWR